MTLEEANILQACKSKAVRQFTAGVITGATFAWAGMYFNTSLCIQICPISKSPGSKQNIVLVCSSSTGFHSPAVNVVLLLGNLNVSLPSDSS